MEETTQLNVRLPKELIKDMEYIAKNLRIKRNDWLKVKIAELISKEIEKTKQNIMATAEGRFIYGSITAEEFKQRMGFKPTKDMLKEMEKEKSLMKKGKSSSKSYIQDIANRIK